MSSKKPLFVWLLVSLAVISSAVSDPIISSITKDQIAEIGDVITLNCTVKDIGKYSLGWSKSSPGESGVPLSIRGTLTLSDPRYEVSVNKIDDTVTVYTLRINKVETTDSGEYECQVFMSSAKKHNKGVKVSVKHAPIISEDRTTKTVTATEGYNLEIFCAADGFPKPTIMWKREFNAIMPTGGHIFIGDRLSIKSAHRLDRGNYYCVADNEIGKPDERLVRVEVEFPPVITIPRPKVAQVKSHSIDLECSVQAYPAAAVFWYKNGAQLKSSGNYQITNIATAFETTDSTLRILSVCDVDYGDFFCNATNKQGQDDSRINLFQPVIAVPNPI